MILSVLSWGMDSMRSRYLARPSRPSRPEKTRALLICLGSRQAKWAYYRQCCMRYGDLLEDISSVCQTLQAFHPDGHFIPGQAVA